MSRDQGIAVGQEAFTFGSGEFALRGTNPAFGGRDGWFGAWLSGRTRPVLEYLGAEVLQVGLSLPGGRKKSFPVGLVHDGKAAATSACQLMGGDLFDLQAGRLREDVGGSDVVWRGFLGEGVEGVEAQVGGQTLGHIRLVVGVVADLAAGDRNSGLGV